MQAARPFPDPALINAKRRRLGYITPDQIRMAHSGYIRTPGAIQMMKKGGRVKKPRLPRRNKMGRFVKK